MRMSRKCSSSFVRGASLSHFIDVSQLEGLFSGEPPIFPFPILPDVLLGLFQVYPRTPSRLYRSLISFNLNGTASGDGKGAGSKYPNNLLLDALQPLHRVLHVWHLASVAR